LQYTQPYCYSYGAYALALLQQKITNKQIIPTVIPPNIILNIRKSYAGGRNEFFEEPATNSLIYSIDFNHMYLSCLDEKYLTGELFYIESTTISQPGFYYIHYESGGVKYPILYWKNPLTNNVYFCNGAGEGLFWYEEILLFMQEGGFVKKVCYAFVSYINSHNYTPFIKRIEHITTTRYKKQLANNLYGRLAMRDFFYGHRIHTSTQFPLYLESKAIKRWVKWYDFYVSENTTYSHYNKYTDISTAAAITSKARVKVYQLIKHLAQTYQVCLVNTDEVIISSNQPPELSKNWDVKVNLISRETFNIKKKQFLTKRAFNTDSSTRPYNLINNMLL
jgi:hypothetical protein